MGVELPPGYTGSEAKDALPEVTGDYLLYVGRLSRGKGVNTLVDYFTRYADATGTGLTLVVAGKGELPPRSHPRVIYPASSANR